MAPAPRNAVFLTGPADLMVFLAGLEQTGGDIGDWVIALMGRSSNIPAALVESCRRMGQGAPTVFLDFAEPDALAAFIGRFGARFRQVAVSHVAGRDEEALLDRLSWERLILTENGIATYLLPAGRARRLGADGAPRHRPDMAFLPLSEHPALGCPTYLRGLPELHLLVHDPAAWDRVRRRMQGLLGLAETAARIAAAARPAAVAGTSLSRTGIVTAAAETAAHRRRLAALLTPGPEAPDLVVWKPHPRDPGGVAPGGAAPGGADLLVLEAPLPLELWLPSGHPGATLHSVASSSLLTAALWHRIRTCPIPLEMETARHPHVAFMQALHAGS